VGRRDFLWRLAVANISDRVVKSKGKELNMKLYLALIITLVLALAGLTRDSLGVQRSKRQQANAVQVDLSKEKVGRESSKFLSVVGNWSIVDDNGKKVLGVDGRRWLRGQPAGGLAEKARSIYGARNEEFIDNVKAWAYFPYAVAKDVPDFQNGDISIRFKLVAGQLDECAGILFNLKPNGDYLTVRFNGMEDNVVLWTFNKGVRKFVKRLAGTCRSRRINGTRYRFPSRGQT
jgi:hypothetical protein